MIRLLSTAALLKWVDGRRSRDDAGRWTSITGGSVNETDRLSMPSGQVNS